jgi:hypothetical protein
MQKKVEECNLDELENVGVTMYSSTGQPLGTKLGRSEKGLPTCKRKSNTSRMYRSVRKQEMEPTS